MIIKALGESGVTVDMDGCECEQMARFLVLAAETGGDHGRDAALAESLSGLFLAAAVIARTHGFVNIPEEVDTAMDAIRERVQGKGGG
jgi:hypothetical protein